MLSKQILFSIILYFNNFILLLFSTFTIAAMQAAIGASTILCQTHKPYRSAVKYYAVIPEFSNSPSSLFGLSIDVFRRTLRLLSWRLIFWVPAPRYVAGRGLKGPRCQGGVAGEIHQIDSPRIE